MKNQQEKKKSGWRGSEDLWLDAAYDMLIESGVDAVRIMPLAKSLGLSRTSFYWHFEDRDMLLEAIVKRWELKNTHNLVKRSQDYAESVTEAMFNIFDCWLDSELFDSRLDLAIRNWANNEPELKLRIDAADRKRVEAIQDIFLRFGYTQTQAETRALAVIYTQVGYISMMVTEDLDTRVQKMPAYIEIYTGLPPTLSEIKRFLSRHGLMHLEPVQS